MTVYRCEDSLESIFTAVYLAYAEKRNHADTMLSLSDDAMLFAEDVTIIPDLEKVRKVMNTINRRFGERDYFHICLALASADIEKAQAVYRTIVWGLSSGCGEGHLFDNLADDWVNKAFKLSRNVWREYHHHMGFVRFSELENGVLFSRIGPKSNILTFLMPHFADRLPMENFMIYDEVRDFFAIHPAGAQWYILLGEQVENMPEFKFSEQELQYRQLFRHFCQTIMIKERANSGLQRNLLPLRYREYMIEF